MWEGHGITNLWSTMNSSIHISSHSGFDKGDTTICCTHLCQLGWDKGEKTNMQGMQNEPDFPDL